MHRLEDQRDKFRAFLFSNHRASSSKKKNEDLNLQQFDDIPSNLNNLYFDVLEDKNYTQIKIDLFTATIRKQIDGFLRTRKEVVSKIATRGQEVKTQWDLNQQLKRKYIKKQTDYKRVLKGEPLEEPTNLLEQMLLDIKKLQDRKTQAELAAQ